MSVNANTTLLRLLLSVIELTSEAEGSDIGVCGRHGNRAEDTVPFASGEDPHIISLSFFQLRAAVFSDRGAGCYIIAKHTDMGKENSKGRDNCYRAVYALGPRHRL